MDNEVSTRLVFYITLAIGGVIGGVLTVWDKVRFVRKVDCAGTHILVCKKIEEVKTSITDLYKQREGDQKELNRNLIELAKFVGNVERFMKTENQRTTEDKQ